MVTENQLGSMVTTMQFCKIYSLRLASKKKISLNNHGTAVLTIFLDYSNCGSFTNYWDKLSINNQDS